MSDYPRGINPGRKALQGAAQNAKPKRPGGLAKSALIDPAQYPEEFLSWLPTFLKYNINFGIQKSQLPPNGLVHLVGASGELAVFLNSWVNFGGTNEPCGYWLDPFNHVHLFGCAKSGTVGAGTPIFTLPAGFRPQYIGLYPAASNNLYGTCRINPDGTVEALTGSNTYFSLSGITFRQYA